MGENLYCFFIDSSHIASLPLDIYLFAVPLPKTQVTNRTLSCGFFFFFSCLVLGFFGGGGGEGSFCLSSGSQFRNFH